MGYQVGVSSGFWSIGKDPNLLGLSTKAAGFGATAGVTFNQIDLETLAELLEPHVMRNIKRVQKELGIKIGLHAEIGDFMALESAERRFWDQSHIRLVRSVRGAVEMGAVYLNIHLSTKPILQEEETRLRPFGSQYPVVAPDGKPFTIWAQKSKAIRDFVKSRIVHGMYREISSDNEYTTIVRRKEAEIIKDTDRRLKEELEAIRRTPGYDQLPPAEKRRIENDAIFRHNEEARRRIKEAQQDPDTLYQAWLGSEFAKYILEAGEIDAYLAIGKHMQETNDPLWSNIVGNDSPERAYVAKQMELNAAVAARYIEGHLTVRDNEANKDSRYGLNGMSVLEYAKKHGLIICFETPEGSREHEALFRFFRPDHSYHFIKKIGSPQIRLCIDFEHMLSQRLDPYVVLPQLPADFGKMVYLFHLGEPKPYWGTAHIPIPLGSQAQEVIYEWLYMMRKKGFRDGIMIFERGGGRSGGKSAYEVFEQSVEVLRKIAASLEKDHPPDQLPLDFYGMSEKNKEVYTRELIAIRDHVEDPLAGVLSVPEEKHTFLSKAAVDKGKGQEWEKRQLR